MKTGKATPFAGIAPEPSRREAVLGLGIAMLAPIPAAARSAPPASTPARAPVASHLAPPPVPLIRLRATKIQRRLAGPDQPESTLFHLVEIDANGAAIPDRPGGDLAFPTLRGREGEPFAIEIENALDQPTSFHLRGARGPNRDDGVAGLTTLALQPGDRTVIPIPAIQTGTFLLAPVLPETVAEQTARGLHAAVIVEEKTVPSFDHDLVLAVSDWRLDRNGVLAEDFGARRDAARVGRLGNRLVVNRAAAPGVMTVRPGAQLRIRMINVANARMIPLKISGFPAQVYAIDSTPCQPFDPLKRTVILAPSSRIEVVLQAPNEAGNDGVIEARLGDGFPILRFRIEGAPLPARGEFIALPDPGLPPAIRLQDATRAEIIIAGGLESIGSGTVATGPGAADIEPAALEKRFPDPARVFTLNGGVSDVGPLAGINPAGFNLAGFSGRPVASVKRGEVLVLALVNRTTWPQVLAIHGHAFRLLHPFDDGWEPYFLDTLYLAPGTTARIALIADNPGKWAIRSTIAEHLASGVATWFEVI